MLMKMLSKTEVEGGKKYRLEETQTRGRVPVLLFLLQLPLLLRLSLVDVLVVLLVRRIHDDAV